MPELDGGKAITSAFVHGFLKRGRVLGDVAR
jgi:hypothetical protein